MSLVVMSIVANIVCECTISEASMLMLVDLLVFLQSLGVLLLLLLLLLLSLCCCFWFTFSSFFFLLSWQISWIHLRISNFSCDFPRAAQKSKENQTKMPDIVCVSLVSFLLVALSTSTDFSIVFFLCRCPLSYSIAFVQSLPHFAHILFFSRYFHLHRSTFAYL